MVIIELNWNVNNEIVYHVCLGPDFLPPSKPFSCKDFSLWLNQVLMEGDKCMWLSQSDFLFYCHFKVMCYMLHSQFATTRDRNWPGWGSTKWVLQLMCARPLKWEAWRGMRALTWFTVHQDVATVSGSLSPSHSVSQPCHWQNPDQQQLGYLLCLLLLSRWSDAESNNTVWDKLHIVFSFNVLNNKKNKKKPTTLQSLFVPEAFFLLHRALQQSHSFILNHHCDEITELCLVIFSL